MAAPAAPLPNPGSSGRPELDLQRAELGLPALKRQFPHLEADALAVFLDAAEGAALGDDSIAALMEMENEVAAGKEDQFGHLPTRGCTVQRNEGGRLEVLLEGGCSPPHVGTVLQIAGFQTFQDNEEKGIRAGVVLPTGEVLALRVAEGPTSFLLEDFGMHELRVANGGTVERCWFMVSSPLGEYGEALDLFNDAYDWVWDGAWTNELEESVLNLLVALDETFSQEGGASITDMLKSSLASPKQRIQKHLSKAIESQDALSLGRAVGSLRATLVQSLCDTFGAGQGMEVSPFYQTIIAFESERFKASSSGKQEELRGALRRMVLAADAHVADLYSCGRGQDFIRRWSAGLRSEIWAMLEGQAPMHPLPFQKMRGGGSGYVADMLASISSFGSAAPLGRAETTEAMTSLAPEAPFGSALSKMKRWCESLVDEQISVGHPMSPFELTTAEHRVDGVLATIHSILSLGLGYVSSSPGEVFESARLVALLDRVRASLPLHAQQEFLREKKRRDRLKDVCRVLRAAKKKGYRLSLSVNTDFKGALQALREHHEDTWVGPALESLWDLMREKKRVFSFELWLHEGDKPKPALIAADFGHAHTFGRAYYVATRFFDRNHRTLMPGFLLAYAEAECLRRAGFELWDLGGADRSPMMQYKPQVALEMHRSEFLLRLWEICRAEFAKAEEDKSQNLSLAESLQKPMTDLGAAAPPMGERVPQGVVFEDLEESDLWGAVQMNQEDPKAADNVKAKKGKKEGNKAQATAHVKDSAAARKKEKAPADGKDAAFAPPSRPENQKDQSEKVPDAKDAAFAPARPENQKNENEKADAKQQFLAAYQRFIAEGMAENEAAAKALKTVRG